MNTDVAKYCDLLARDITSVFLSNKSQYNEYIDSDKELDIWHLDLHSASYRVDDIDVDFAGIELDDMLVIVAKKAMKLLEQHNINIKLTS